MLILGGGIIGLEMGTGQPSCKPSAAPPTEGVTKLLFDDSPEAHGHAKILGGGMVGEIALVIEMGSDAVDIGKTIHPHQE
jgi:pyruvate/2-oxoglutarate dehydrogenase complex dihydrolipoamide dehydrogenase (E3) component